MSVTLTETAVKRIKSLVPPGTDQGLRIQVKGGGCSGLTYKMEIGLPTANDRIFEKDDAKVFIDRKSYLYINGTELHYEETVMKSGFDIRNPNAVRKCGCGASFSV